MLLARNKYVRHCVHQETRHVAPKSLPASDIGVMPQGMDETCGRPYVRAIPTNDSALIPKA